MQLVKESFVSKLMNIPCWRSRFIFTCSVPIPRHGLTEQVIEKGHLSLDALPEDEEEMRIIEKAVVGPWGLVV